MSKVLVRHACDLDYEFPLSCPEFPKCEMVGGEPKVQNPYFYIDNMDLSYRVLYLDKNCSLENLFKYNREPNPQKDFTLRFGEIGENEGII